MLSWNCKCFFCFLCSTFPPCSSPAAVPRLMLHDSDPELCCVCLLCGNSLVCTWLGLWCLAQESQREMSLPMGSLLACARRCCKQDTQTCAEQSLYLVVSTAAQLNTGSCQHPQSTQPLCCYTATTSGEEQVSAAPGHILHGAEFPYFTSFSAS